MRKELKVVLGVSLLILLLSVASISAITGSMGNVKMILYPEVNGFLTTTIEKSILTRNVNDDPINVTLETSDEFLEIVDESFILNPGEEKKAEFLVKVRKEGTYNGKINVFFSPVEGKDPGVVLSSNIVVIAKKDQGYEEIDETEEQENEEDGEEDNGVSVSITGGAVHDEEADDEKKSLGGVWVLGGMSFILLAVFVTLMFILSKKGKSKKNGKKKRRTINARKKK